MKTAHPLRFGIQAATERYTWPELVEVFQAAEETGYDTAWLPDHFLPTLTSDRGAPYWDAWTALAALAPLTRRVRLGVLVTNNNFRHPAVLARQAANVDVVSGGRLEFGIGAGWMALEHTMYGLEFPDAPERLDRLEEAIQVVNMLWTQRQSTFRGRHYRLQGAFLAPKPAQMPRPPVLVGGGGEKRTLRIAARYADEWNSTGAPSVLARKAAVLERHCLGLGRDPGGIVRSVAVPFAFSDSAQEAERRLQTQATRRGISVEEAQGLMLYGTPAMMVEQLQEHIALGFSHFILQLAGPHQTGGVRRFGREGIPLARGENHR